MQNAIYVRQFHYYHKTKIEVAALLFEILTCRFVCFINQGETQRIKIDTVYLFPIINRKNFKWSPTHLLANVKYNNILNILYNPRSHKDSPI